VCRCNVLFSLHTAFLTVLFMAEVTVVQVCDVYGYSPPDVSSVAKDAGVVAKDRVIPASRCQGVTTTAAVEPLQRYNDLANQRSLSDKLDLSTASAGIMVAFVSAAERLL